MGAVMADKRVKEVSAKVAILPAGEDVPDGSFRATFATFNTIDHDRDVTLPGAFPVGAPVKVASWGHRWDKPNIGVGVIGADDVSAWVDGRLFIDDSINAREVYAALKGNGDLQEWSYGFEVEESSQGEFQGQQVTILRKVNPFEISPVMRGAGIGTGTDWVKALDGQTLAEQAAAALAVATIFGDRVKALAALRAKEGRTLSETNRRRISSLLDAMKTAMSDVEELLSATEPAPKADELEAAALRLRRLRAQMVTVSGA